MEFKEGHLYRAKKVFVLIGSGGENSKSFNKKKIAPDTVLTFLKWETSWLTNDLIIKYFLVDNMIVFDSHGAYYNPEDYFEEIVLDES